MADDKQIITKEIEEENSAEVVETPANLKLRLEACPKCEYKRQPWDEKFVSPFECPKCGVVYALALEELERLNRGKQLQDEAEAEALRRQAQELSAAGKGSGGAMFAGEARSMWIALVFVILLGVLAAFFLW